MKGEFHYHCFLKRASTYHFCHCRETYAKLGCSQALSFELDGDASSAVPADNEEDADDKQRKMSRHSLNQFFKGLGMS